MLIYNLPLDILNLISWFLLPKRYDKDIKNINPNCQIIK